MSHVPLDHDMVVEPCSLPSGEDGGEGEFELDGGSVGEDGRTNLSGQSGVLMRRQHHMGAGGGAP